MQYLLIIMSKLSCWLSAEFDNTMYDLQVLLPVLTNVRLAIPEQEDVDLSSTELEKVVFIYYFMPLFNISKLLFL